MKKSLKVLGIVVGIVIVVVTVFNVFGLKEINSADIKQINFISMPSPPKEKIIDDNKEIEDIINIINQSRKNFCGFNNSAGWEGLIKLSNGEKITLLASSIIYNHFMYKLSDENYKKLFRIYDQSNSTEKLYK